MCAFGSTLDRFGSHKLWMFVVCLLARFHMLRGGFLKILCQMSYPSIPFRIIEKLSSRYWRECIMMAYVAFIAGATLIGLA